MHLFVVYTTNKCDFDYKNYYICFDIVITGSLLAELEWL